MVVVFELICKVYGLNKVIVLIYQVVLGVGNEVVKEFYS